MDALLAEANLTHLSTSLSSLTLNEAYSLLEAGRPHLLARLKELGMRKPPELSKLAKAVAMSKRDEEGVGTPVVAFAYSTGLSKEDGRALMKPLIDAVKAAGFPDTLVLDHCNEAPYAGKVSTHEEYAAALRDTIYKAGDKGAGENFAGRPLILVGHSNGSVGCYGLARLLQRKVRLLVVLGRRPPSMPLLPDALGVETEAEALAMSAHDLAQAFSTSYENKVLKSYTANPDERTWQPQIRAAVAMARAQYASPCVLCAAEHIAAAICAPGEPVPAAAKVSAPIVAIAAARETARGETAARVEAWRELAAGEFDPVKTVDCTHMDLPKHEWVVQRVVAAVRPLAKLSAEERSWAPAE